MYEDRNSKIPFSKKFENFIYKIYDAETRFIEKILKRFPIYSISFMLITGLIIVIFGVGLGIIARNNYRMAEIISVVTSILFFQYLFICFIEQGIERKKLKETTTYDLLKKHVDSVGVVIDCAKETGNKNLLYNSEDWIIKLDIYIYMLSSIVRRRKFNDFDIAACLVSAIITSCERTHENVIFAFKCAQKIISKPKSYIRHENLASVITLEAVENFDEMSITSSNENDDYAKMCISHIEDLPYEIDEEALLMLSNEFYSYYKRCIST